MQPPQAHRRERGGGAALRGEYQLSVGLCSSLVQLLLQPCGPESKGRLDVIDAWSPCVRLDPVAGPLLPGLLVERPVAQGVDGLPVLTCKGREEVGHVDLDIRVERRQEQGHRYGGVVVAGGGIKVLDENPSILPFKDRLPGLSSCVEELPVNFG